MEERADYELYRQTTLGFALSDALDDMLSNGLIDEDMAMTILLQFDKTINEALKNSVRMKMNFSGRLHTYRLCDDVWTFILEDPSFRIDSESFGCDKVKIVACNGTQTIG